MQKESIRRVKNKPQTGRRHLQYSCLTETPGHNPGKTASQETGRKKADRLLKHEQIGNDTSEKRISKERTNV